VHFNEASSPAADATFVHHQLHKRILNGLPTMFAGNYVAAIHSDSVFSSSPSPLRFVSFFIQVIIKLI